MALLRFRLAYIIVAVLRSTALRRVVDGSLDHHRHRHGDTSSSLHPGVNTVRPHPSGSGRSVLTPGPLRLLKSDRAPHLWCVAVKRQSAGPSSGRLTGRSTSSPGRGALDLLLGYTSMSASSMSNSPATPTNTKGRNKRPRTGAILVATPPLLWDITVPPNPLWSDRTAGTRLSAGVGQPMKALVRSRLHPRFGTRGTERTPEAHAPSQSWRLPEPNRPRSRLGPGGTQGGLRLAGCVAHGARCWY